MKFSTIALAYASTVVSVSSESCDTTTLATSLASIITPAYACQTATGYTLVPPSSMPTSAQIKSICSECQDLITAAKNVTFPTCTLTIDGTDVALDTLLNEIVGQCGSSSSSSSSAETTVGSTTTTSPPSGSSANGSTPASSSSDSDTIQTPSPATTTGTPPTTSSPSTTTSTPSTSTSAGVSTTVAVAVSMIAAVVTILVL